MSCDRSVNEITSRLSTKSVKSTNSDGFALSSPSTPRVVSSPRFRVSPSSRCYGVAPIESRCSLHSELSSYPSRDQFSFPKVDKRIFHSYQTQPSVESPSLSLFEPSGSPSSRFQAGKNDFRVSTHSRIFAVPPPDEREFLSPALLDLLRFLLHPTLQFPSITHLPRWTLFSTEFPSTSIRQSVLKR